ncbi:hypothetical protein D9O31_26990 [Salmonella enterica]|uniref:Uncharacterized protein n=1 Tax=Salmonella enterica TaxID=28901 RepID=A0A403T8A9_SALER|nr:hypothetical protein [Salmonella enterica]
MLCTGDIGVNIIEDKDNKYDYLLPHMAKTEHSCREQTEPEDTGPHNACALVVSTGMYILPGATLFIVVKNPLTDTP